MSLEVTFQTKYPKVRIFYSTVAELIVLVNVLADPKHHASAQDEIKKISEALSQESIRFLRIIAELPFQGIEFLEILLDCQAFDSVDEFVKELRQYDTIRFIRTMTGEQLSNAQINQLMEDKQALPQRLNDLPWLYRGKSAVYESLFYETSAFKESLVSLLQDIYHSYFATAEVDLKPQYQAAIETLYKGLAENSAYDVAEKIMNRRIDESPSVNSIIFLPSYYVNPHYIMAYNHSSRIFLYDMRRKEQDKGRANQNLTNALKVLSDSTRLEILRLLILQPTYGKIIADRLHLTTATISHHLDVLSSAHLIHESRNGNTKYFSADEDKIQKLVDELNDYLYNK
ncbi:MAG TPA: metalloregulator ArsR/SmtB family transcription factor [Ruminiclostridium sp.]|nr:metalloregulator ArsR/SmtB family transcription factor [Ruminiclostridium sp.]